MAGALSIAPRLVVAVLFGARYQGITPELRLLSIESALLGVLNVITYFLIARRSLAAFIPWLGVAVVIGGSLILDVDAEQLAWSMLMVVAVTTVGMGAAAALWKPSSRSRSRSASVVKNPPILYDASWVDSAGDLDLTVVVPFFNPGRRLKPHVANILRILRTSELTFEVIAVSDGSTDGSDEGLESLGSELRVIRLPINSGKGYALRSGFCTGRGRYVGFIDGDGDIPAQTLQPFIELLQREMPAMAIASKWHPASEVVSSPVRRTYSWTFQLLVRILLQVDVTDTQAGLKLVRRDLLIRALPVLEETGFLLDVELLAIARRLGYSNIVELPVRIKTRHTSSISLGSAALMALKIVALHWKLHITHHYDRELERSKQLVVSREGDTECTDLSNVSGPVARPLKILIYNWRDLAHPNAGGAEVWTHKVASAWVRFGHTVTIFCAGVDGLPEIEDIDGVRYVRRGSRHSVYRLGRRYYRREGRGRFDLVIDEVNTRPFGCASWVRDTPVAAVIHQLAREVWFYEMPLVAALTGRLLFERRWLRKLRTVPVITVSPSSKQSLEAAGLRRITIVPEGFDQACDELVQSDAFQKEERPTLCWVGRMSPNKRPDHALRAFEMARSQLPNAQLWMIGSGPMSDKLKRTASESVNFFGHISDGEKHQLMGRAHALLATSVREGWGLTVTEAAAVGTATIGYAVPGLVDSIAASGGYLVSPSIEELGDEIVRRVPRLARGEDGCSVHPAGVLSWDDVAVGVLRAACVRDSPASSWIPASRTMLERHDEEPRLVPTPRKVPELSAFDETRFRRRLTLARWSLAGAGIVALAGAAATAPYVRASEALANAALVALALAGILLLVETRRARGHPAAWMPMRGSLTMWRGATVAVAGLTALACQSWFSQGGAIAGGDVIPPVGTAWLRQIFAPIGWSGSNLGGPAANELQAPWAAVYWAVHWAGGSGALAQRLWMTLLFVGAALAVLVLLRILGCGPGAAGVGTAIYIFNCYVVSVVAMNAVFLAALALLPALPAVILAVARRRLGILPGALLILLSAPLLGYVYQNPPLVLLLVAAVCLSIILAAYLGGPTSARRVGRLLLIGGPLLVAGAMYWVIPAAIQLHTAALGTLSNSASWLWTEGRSTIANGFWLNTTWGWSFKSYYPFAPAYGHFPLALIRYLLPLAAFAVLLLPSPAPGNRMGNRRLAIIAPTALCALFLLALSTGTNPPGSVIFDPLYRLPFGWLLREPGRFLMGAGLAYAVLVALGVDALARGVHASPWVDVLGSKRLRRAAVVLALAVVVAIVPGYPLVTGAIVPTSRELLPSEHVNVPVYWQSMATTIDHAGRPGAVLMLPSDDFYQMPYTWGFYGADTFAENMMSRPVIDPIPQVYYGPATDELLSSVQLVSQYILTHRWNEVTRLLDAFHSPYVLVRGDINASFPQRSITSPARLATALALDPDMRPVTRDGPLELYSSVGERSAKLAKALAVSTPQQAPDLAILGLLPGNSALVTRPPRQGSPFALQLANVDQWKLGRNSLTTSAMPPQSESLSLGVLDVRNPELVPLAEAPRAVHELTITELGGGRYRFTLPLGASMLGQTSVRNRGWGPIGDCYDVRPSTADLTSRVVAGAGPAGTTEIELSAHGDRACLQRPIQATDGSVFMSLESRDAKGLVPQFCLWEMPARRCASLPPLSASTSWTHYQTVAQVPRGQMVRLFLYATPDGSGNPTTSDFAAVSVRRMPETPPTLDLVGTPRRARSGVSSGCSTQVATKDGVRRLGPIQSLLMECSQAGSSRPEQRRLRCRMHPDIW